MDFFSPTSCRLQLWVVLVVVVEVALAVEVVVVRIRFIHPFDRLIWIMISQDVVLTWVIQGERGKRE